MKLKNYLLISLSTLIIAGVIIYAVQKSREKVKRKRVAEEGYETAYDVLFPDKHNQNYKAGDLDPVL